MIFVLALLETTPNTPFDLKLWLIVFETMIIFPYSFQTTLFDNTVFVSTFYISSHWLHPYPQKVAHSLNSGNVWGLKPLLEMIGLKNLVLSILKQATTSCAFKTAICAF